jgi:mannose-6-phosphate isomerase-like protein (cupin superfamily)
LSNGQTLLPMVRRERHPHGFEYDARTVTGQTCTALSGTTFQTGGDQFFFKVVGATNDDAFSMCDVWNTPQGGVPPHIDHRDDEAFFVLEGTCDCRLGDRNLACGPGESFFTPRGTPHGIMNMGDIQALTLIVQSPGSVI